MLDTPYSPRYPKCAICKTNPAAWDKEERRPLTAWVPRLGEFLLLCAPCASVQPRPADPEDPRSDSWKDKRVAGDFAPIESTSDALGAEPGEKPMSLGPRLPRA